MSKADRPRPHEVLLITDQAGNEVTPINDEAGQPAYFTLPGGATEINITDESGAYVIPLMGDD